MAYLNYKDWKKLNNNIFIYAYLLIKYKNKSKIEKYYMDMYYNHYLPNWAKDNKEKRV